MSALLKDMPLEIIAIEDGELLYDAHFMKPQQADELFKVLKSETNWQQHTVKLMGNTFLSPRLSSWIGDEHTSYGYSGVRHQPQPWTSTLSAIKYKIEAAIGQQFNSVLLNYYRHGQESMGFHSDDEKELGHNPIIASLSLGAPRRFVLKHKIKKHLVRDITLDTGSLLVMQGATQTFWQHGIPKTRQPVGERINLTFRWIH